MARTYRRIDICIWCNEDDHDNKVASCQVYNKVGSRREISLHRQKQSSNISVKSFALTNLHSVYHLCISTSPITTYSTFLQDVHNGNVTLLAIFHLHNFRVELPTITSLDPGRILHGC